MLRSKASKTSVSTSRLAITIKEHRTRMEWSQSQLAEFLNVSQPTVARWENGTRYPQRDVLVRLARLFRITWRDL